MDFLVTKITLKEVMVTKRLRYPTVISTIIILYAVRHSTLYNLQ